MNHKIKRLPLLLLIISISMLFSACGNNDGYEVETEYENDASQEYYDSSGSDDYTDYLEYVDSTCFESVGYCDDDEVLVVRFLDSGSAYIYYDVPYSEYSDLINADSIGGYYNSDIKDYYYCEQIE